MINAFMETTNSVCDHLREHRISQTNCETNFALIKLLVYTAEEKKRVIFESISHSHVSKRGIPYKTIAKAAQIPFGLCDRFCIQRTNTVVNKLTDSNNTEVNFLEKQVKVIKLDRDKGPETDIIFDVIQATNVGLIHPSLLTPNELLKQLLNIKIGMPSGTDLPIDLNESNVQEMIPLSDISIYYSNDKIVFILNIPLVYQYELSLFQLIPIPNRNDNNCVYIKPNYKYLAVSKSKEIYSVYDEIDQSLCKHASDFLLCPEIYPLHPRSGRPICEVLLQELKEVPDSCEIIQVQLRVNLFHKLKFKNEWIYATPGETIFITCDQEKRSTNNFLERTLIRRNKAAFTQKGPAKSTPTCANALILATRARGNAPIIGFMGFGFA
ncbi:Envelope fusion protein, partial [Aphis craccivora]